MTTPAPSRRTVLRTGLVLAGGSLAVAAGCSPDDDAAPTDTAQPSPDQTPTNAPSPNGSASAPPDGPSVAKADVPEGGGVVLTDADYVVTQPEAGQYRAFSSICTHQGCPVDEITNSEILCPCHGSAFSAADGSVIQGPATEGLAAATLVEAGDQLVITS